MDSMNSIPDCGSLGSLQTKILKIALQHAVCDSDGELHVEGLFSKVQKALNTNPARSIRSLEKHGYLVVVAPMPGRKGTPSKRYKIVADRKAIESSPASSVRAKRTMVNVSFNGVTQLVEMVDGVLDINITITEQGM